MNLAGKRLALSFDNGPFPGVTPEVLDTLAERSLSATFFVCGKDVAEPEKRALAEEAKVRGHRIGNHTQTHRIELGATQDPGAPAAEIGAAQEALADLACAERWFRPYGAGGVLGPRLLSEAAVSYLKEGAYSLVLWNSVPRDWEDPEGWPERALQDLAENEATLLVLHDVPTGAMKALPRFLDAALEAGVAITPDPPECCVPIFRGEPRAPLEGWVSR